MAKITKPQILLTNDDGIQSPGLWAAAGALAAIGRVTVAAPAEQSSGMGRSLPSTSSGIIHEQKLRVNGQEWIVYAVSGSPAQAIQHGVLEIMPKKPDLVVSGINYGENVGLGTTISGTVGAAMEGPRWVYPRWPSHSRRPSNTTSPTPMRSISRSPRISPRISAGCF